MSVDKDKLEQFIEYYLHRGWGSMTKNDFEVWIFYQIMNTPKYGYSSKTPYQLAFDLGIPESKIKKLEYEAKLKYSFKDQNYEKVMKDKVLEILKSVQYKKQVDKLQFVVTDKLVRQYISDILSKNGRFFDTSFNSNIVSISIDDYLELIKHLYSEAQIDDLINNAKQSLAHVVTKFPGEPSELLIKVFKGFINGVLKDTVGEFTVEAITKSYDEITAAIKAEDKINSKQI